ncbi:MAG: alginate lyase family protein [Fidelibacterota bacterium]|nr:MAG: alginate lyase family protein [Candidatus Neomarinimicrobiota bacterium]
MIVGRVIQAGASAAAADGQNVFQHLNLDYPGLESVKAALDRGDSAEAERELLTYFQTRTNRHLEWVYFPGDFAEADLYTANIFTFRRYRHDFGPHIDWTFQASDSEWHFSLNRFRWFSSFIEAHQQTGDDKYPQAWMSQIGDWIGQCEPGYPRTIDTGRRLESWVKSYDYFITRAKSPVITPEFHALMLESMRQQAEFLYQPEHWRRYSNWGTFECSGLALFTLMFPEFKRNDVWLHEVWYRMRNQLTDSYHSDGMHIEVSPSYHAHEMEVWFNFIRMAELNGVASPLRPQLTLQPVQELFDAPAEALMHFYKPTGVVPQVGDTDKRDERYLLRQMGTFWNKPALTYVATGGREGTPPDRTSAAFPEGGYFIMRSGWGQAQLEYQDELYLLFDVGTNQPWHAHYDILNVVMTAYGYDLLLDPGRFTYTGGEERDYFKSTAAHNTMVIDGEDQPRYYTPEPAFWRSMDGFDYVIGIQDSHPQVTHARSVIFVKPTYWIVVDRLQGKSRHRYDQYWHLSDEAADKVQVFEKGRRIIAPHLVILSAEGKTDAAVEEGYVSRAYRQKVTAPVIRHSLNKRPPVTWTTVLYPYRSEIPALEVTVLESDVRDHSDIAALRLSTPSGDFFFLEQSKGGPFIKASGLETDAQMVLLHMDSQGGILGYQAVEASFITYHGLPLMEVQSGGIHHAISVQRNKIEIRGDCPVSFKMWVKETPAVFLNDEKIQVQRDQNYISWSRTR